MVDPNKTKSKQPSPKRDTLEVLESLLFEAPEKETDPKKPCVKQTVATELEAKTGVFDLTDDSESTFGCEDTDIHYHDGISDAE